MVSMRERLFSVELTFVLFFGHRPRSGAEIDKAIASVRDGAEIIELKQVHLSEPVRDQLATAGTRAGVDVRLSRR